MIRSRQFGAKAIIMLTILCLFLAPILLGPSPTRSGMAPVLARRRLVGHRNTPSARNFSSARVVVFTGKAGA
jgi:hypothetical protein